MAQTCTHACTDTKGVQCHKTLQAFTFATHAHTHSLSHTHTHTHTYTHSHTHSHTHTHTHTNAQGAVLYSTRPAGNHAALGSRAPRNHGKLVERAISPIVLNSDQQPLNVPDQSQFWSSAGIFVCKRDYEGG